MNPTGICSSIHILTSNFQILLSRDWRGDLPPNYLECFIEKEKRDSNDLQTSPIIYDACLDVTFAYIRHNGLYILSTSKHRSDGSALLTFMLKLIDIFQYYFHSVEEESIRDNFVIIYELLDEVIDHGYPQFTDAKILSEFITVGANALSSVVVPEAITNSVSWRSPGIKYKKNEVFLDVVETVDLSVNSAGSVVRSNVSGVLKMKAFLSGMPECKLGLNESIVLAVPGRDGTGKSITLEDVKFHHCVRLDRFENEKSITFIPPDGAFNLMSYRLSNPTENPLIALESSTEIFSRTRIKYTIKLFGKFKEKCSAVNVEVKIPVARDATSPEVNVAVGNVMYVPEQESLIWSIKSLPGQKEYILQVKICLPSVNRAQMNEALRNPPIALKFEVPYFTVSGVQVRYLKVSEKSGYQSLPWVRYTTEAGTYEFKM
jgi:AP-1 complex subunit mu